jgi:hypothetical protein
VTPEVQCFLPVYAEAVLEDDVFCARGMRFAVALATLANRLW